MTFYDPEKAYLQHTQHYKLPHGRMFPIDGAPGASGIGPLYQAEHSKFGVIDFQMRGAARSFGNGKNYVSGIINEGDYAQFEHDGEVTVENTGFQGILNDVVIGRQDDGIAWETLDINQNNYLFVKIVEEDRGTGAYASSRRNNDLITFAQDNPEHPDQQSMLVAYRPSGTGSQIQTNLASKSYVDLAHHIASKNQHGDPWMQSGTIISSGINVLGEAFAAGNAKIKSGLTVGEQTTLDSAGGFIWPDGVFHNDALFRGASDFKGNALFQQVSGVEAQVGQAHFTFEKYGSPYNSGTLAGPGAAPLFSGADAAVYNFGDLHQSGNIVLGKTASIDGIRPDMYGVLLDDHLTIQQNNHALTPVRLSGVGRMGVGDPSQWGPHPNTPPADSPYWRMQGNWPVTSGISLDGIDFSVMQSQIDGTVMDRMSTAKSVILSGTSVYRFEEASGTIFKDSSANFDLDELSSVTHQQSSVSAAFGYSALMTSGAGSIKTDRPLPIDRFEPFSFAGWFNGIINPINQSGTTLVQHSDQDHRGWALTKEAFGSGISLEMFSHQGGGKAVVRNSLAGLNDGAWNYITAVYDGVAAYVGVNGTVDVGAGAPSGWAGGVAEGGDQEFSLLAPARNVAVEAQKNVYKASFVIADLASGQYTFASGYGGGNPLYTIYEEVAAGVFKVRRDTILIDDGSSNFTVYEPDPANRYDGKVVYGDVAGYYGKTTEEIGSGTSGWVDLGNSSFAHGIVHGSGVTSMIENFFISSDGVNYSGIEASFASDGVNARWLRSGVAVAVASRAILSAGIRSELAVDEQDFTQLDFIQSGAGGYEYTYQHPYKSTDLILDVWRRMRQPAGSFIRPLPDVIITPPEDMEVLVDKDFIKIQVQDAASRFRGKLVVGDGRQHIGGNYTNARVDDVVYEVGKAWPQYQQNFTVPVGPFVSGVHSGNQTEYHHKHLMLPPDGEFVAIAPEYPRTFVSGNSPGTFESSRRFDKNWYDWYAYIEEDAIIFTRIPVPTGVTRLASLSLDAHVSAGGKGKSKIQVEVRDTDDAIVGSVAGHWLHPSEQSTSYLFSGGGLGSDLGGNFDSGKMFEVMVRMRSVSGHGVHVGPLSARFL